MPAEPVDTAAASTSPLTCPFCGRPETERLRIEDKLVVIFPCMFSPALDPSLSGEDLRRAVADFAAKGSAYFQEQCDRLHYFVTKGAGAVLPGPRPRSGTPQAPPDGEPE